VQADPTFLHRSRQVVGNSLGLSPSVVAKLLNAEGTASLHAFLALLGVVGLAYAGLVLMDTVRQGLRSIWAKKTERVMWWRRYLC
jgi:uncharacterized BrkB/YihY/UPF0761 family membrane protein